jgi:hypothetical protein
MNLLKTFNLVLRMLEDTLADDDVKVFIFKGQLVRRCRNRAQSFAYGGRNIEPGFRYVAAVCIKPAVDKVKDGLARPATKVEHSSLRWRTEPGETSDRTIEEGSVGEVVMHAGILSAQTTAIGAICDHTEPRKRQVTLNRVDIRPLAASLDVYRSLSAL